MRKILTAALVLLFFAAQNGFSQTAALAPPDKDSTPLAPPDKDSAPLAPPGKDSTPSSAPAQASPSTPKAASAPTPSERAASTPSEKTPSAPKQTQPSTPAVGGGNKKTPSEAPKKANFIIGGGLALSATEAKSWMSSTTTYYTSDGGFGVNAYIDYMLPISIPLSLGVEIGSHGSSFSNPNQYGGSTEDTVTAIPLLLRAAYHFDLNPKLDLYLVGKIGYVPGAWEGGMKKMAEGYGCTTENPGGMGLGLDVGAAWYFTEKLGIFAELGFDRYELSANINDSDGSLVALVETPFSRVFTLGLSVKL
jgi:hypothetical protein